MSLPDQQEILSIEALSHNERVVAITEALENSPSEDIERLTEQGEGIMSALRDLHIEDMNRYAAITDKERSIADKRALIAQLMGEIGVLEGEVEIEQDRREEIGVIQQKHCRDADQLIANARRPYFESLKDPENAEELADVLAGLDHATRKMQEAGIHPDGITIESSEPAVITQPHATPEVLDESRSTNPGVETDSLPSREKFIAENDFETQLRLQYALLIKHIDGFTESTLCDGAIELYNSSGDLRILTPTDDIDEDDIYRKYDELNGPHTDDESILDKFKTRRAAIEIFTPSRLIDMFINDSALEKYHNSGQVQMLFMPGQLHEEYRANMLEKGGPIKSVVHASRNLDGEVQHYETDDFIARYNRLYTGVTEVWNHYAKDTRQPKLVNGIPTAVQFLGGLRRFDDVTTRGAHLTSEMANRDKKHRVHERQTNYLGFSIGLTNYDRSQPYWGSEFKGMHPQDVNENITMIDAAEVQSHVFDEMSADELLWLYTQECYEFVDADSNRIVSLLKGYDDLTEGDSVLRFEEDGTAILLSTRVLSGSLNDIQTQQISSDPKPAGSERKKKESYILYLTAENDSEHPGRVKFSLLDPIRNRGNYEDKATRTIVRPIVQEISEKLEARDAERRTKAQAPKPNKSSKKRTKKRRR